MNNATQQIDNKAWNFAPVERDDRLSYVASTKQITFLLSLDKADVTGDIYKGLLAKSAAEDPEGAGQYFTPREPIATIVDCVQPKREGKNHDGRERAFTYDEIINRDKANLEANWLKDGSLEDSDDLPTAPDKFAAIAGEFKE